MMTTEELIASAVNEAKRQLVATFGTQLTEQAVQLAQQGDHLTAYAAQEVAIEIAEANAHLYTGEQRTRLNGIIAELKDSQTVRAQFVLNQLYNKNDA